MPAQIFKRFSNFISYTLDISLEFTLEKNVMVKTSFRPCSRSNFQIFLNFSHNYCHKFLYVAIPPRHLAHQKKGMVNSLKFGFKNGLKFILVLLASNLALNLPSKKYVMVKTSFRPCSRSNFQKIFEF